MSLTATGGVYLMNDDEKVRMVVQEAVDQVADDRIRQALLLALVSPFRKEVRTWEYGSPTRHIVWHIASLSSTEQITYCGTGYGPEYAWGLGLVGEKTLGSDDRWHRTLMDAFLASTQGSSYRPANYEVP